MQEGVNYNKIKLINALGEIIKELREGQGKTIYTISAEVGMSKSTWREAENADCKDMKLTTLWKIAEGLDIPLAKLIDKLNTKLGKDFSLIDND